MRVIIILATLALSHGAKLERTYLPPSNARTAGGSSSFLQTPLSGLSANAFPQGSSNSYENGIPQLRNASPQPVYGTPQIGNGSPQLGNDFSQFGKTDVTGFNSFRASRPERPRAAFERNAAILRQDNSNDGEAYAYAYETENGIYAEESGVATNGVEAQGGYSYTGDDGQVYSVRYTADQNGFVPEGEHLPTSPPIPEEILKALEQNARDEAAGIYDDGSYKQGKYAADNNNQYNYPNPNAVNNAFNGNDDAIVTNSALTRSGNVLAPNAGISRSYGTPISGNAQTYSAANAGNAAPFNARRTGNAASFSAPRAGTVASYSAPNTGNAAVYNSFNAPRSFSNSATAASSFNAPRIGVPTFSPISAARNSVDRAYLPPVDNQRGQSFRRRQQSFDARTGYKY